MNSVGIVLMSAGTLLAGGYLLLSHRSLAGTTLVSTRIWVLLGVSTWSAAWFLDLSAGVLSPALADHVWYAAAVLALCPPIAVLGARRPGTRVWAGFILCPMLLVLGWPVGTLWLQGSELSGIHLETPQLVAFCLVLIMGIGNYCGTRYTLAALFYGTSVASLVLCVSVVSPTWMADRAITRCWSTVLMLIVVFQIKSANRPVATSRFDRLWLDFFDTFGIVWGRRIQDRVNALAEKEKLPLRLELDAFVWKFAPTPSKSPEKTPENSPDPLQSTHPAQTQIDAEIRLEQILRWLLRRFVDPDWINQRLGSNSSQTSRNFTVDA